MVDNFDTTEKEELLKNIDERIKAFEKEEWIDDKELGGYSVLMFLGEYIQGRLENEESEAWDSESNDFDYGKFLGEFLELALGNKE